MKGNKNKLETNPRPKNTNRNYEVEFEASILTTEVVLVWLGNKKNINKRK